VTLGRLSIQKGFRRAVDADGHASALRITHRQHSPDVVAKLFREARPPVIGRITDDAFQLDVRAVEDPGAFAVEFSGSNPTATAALAK